jgi:phenylalanyl-tRNA synthetase alpha chain
MPTSSFVESGFWGFDALFVPQQHLARDLQDTFYLPDPVASLKPPPDFYEQVSRVYEHGGFGSVGYRASWSDAESHKLLLRTHTTASSVYMLYKLAARCRGETLKDGDEHTFGMTPGCTEHQSESW